MPFRRPAGVGLTSVLDLACVVVRDAGVSRRLKDELLEIFDRFEGSLEIFLGEELLVRANCSRGGFVTCGNVDDRDEGTITG